MSRIICPFCGKGISNVTEGSSVGSLGNEGSPTPQELFEQTGGGENFISEMEKHGYVTTKNQPSIGDSE